MSKRKRNRRNFGAPYSGGNENLSEQPPQNLRDLKFSKEIYEKEKKLKSNGETKKNSDDEKNADKEARD